MDLDSFLRYIPSVVDLTHHSSYTTDLTVLVDEVTVGFLNGVASSIRMASFACSKRRAVVVHGFIGLATI